MINVITTQEGFVISGEERTFTKNELEKSYWMLNYEQVWIEGNGEIIMLDINECTIDGVQCTSSMELVQKIGLNTNV